jgi:hypothetical protein
MTGLRRNNLLNQFILLFICLWGDVRNVLDIKVVFPLPPKIVRSTRIPRGPQFVMVFTPNQVGGAVKEPTVFTPRRL